MNNKYQWLLLACLICQWIIKIQCNSDGEQDATFESNLKRVLVRRQSCPSSNQCLSKWGYCGTTADYCGDGCKAGPCIGPPKPSGCPDPNACLSQWGYCGYTAEHCGQGCQGGPCTGTGGGGGGVTTPAPTTRPITQSPPSPCPDPNACLSQWGYCGYSADYCGQGCRGGPCTGTGGGGGGGGGGNGGNGGSNNGGVITDSNFACAFNNLDAPTRGQRLDGLRQSGYKPANADEAAVFLGHVYHETDGLRTLTEYCAPGCGPNYVQSWCSVQAVPGKLYYGRGWFQLSYPCNYHAAGQALGLDLLNNPDLVSQQQDVAVKTAVWYFQANNMVDPARRGDFAATTRIINGPRECNGGPGFASQQTRVATYRRVRQCFGLGEPAINPTC